MNYKLTISGEEYDRLEALSIKDKERWDNRRGGGKQCNNNYKGCMIGALSEHTVIQMLRDKQDVSDIQPFGEWERKTGRDHSDKADIHFTYKNNKEYKVEVKGCNVIYPLGQVTTYHVDKYIDEGVDYIMLVSIKLEETHRIAICEVYSITPPTLVKQWAITPNLKGNPCHTLNHL